jgi:galactokinase
MINVTPISELNSAFQTAYGYPADAVSIAPGRVNLIGEHTDYNDGFVLPCALEFNTRILFKKRNDTIINVRSMSYPDESEQFDHSQNLVPGTLHWGNYIRAVVFVLKREGHQLSGYDMLIDSNVPQGSGLSSSAALEVALGGLFNHADSLSLSLSEIAVFGQKAENDFIDCQCGIMDQLISACGQVNNALMLDCRTLETQAVAIPNDLNVVIVNSNYPRKLADSEYNVRRIDCENAARKMGVDMLRDADMTLLAKHQDQLSENEYKRAKHVITENQRVLDAVDALQNNNLERLSELMSASHHSMQHDFEITVPAIDGLVEICSRALGKSGGARMTGGGFGGAVVCLCREQDLAKLIKAVEDNYHQQFSLTADIYVCNAGNGLKIEAL